jgi:hypothetical protein
VVKVWFMKKVRQDTACRRGGAPLRYLMSTNLFNVYELASIEMNKIVIEGEHDAIDNCVTD